MTAVNNKKFKEKTAHLSVFDVEIEELELKTLRKLCKDKFGATFENMDKQERPKAFYALLKEYVYLSTYLDSDHNIRVKEGQISKEEKNE